MILKRIVSLSCLIFVLVFFLRTPGRFSTSVLMLIPPLEQRVFFVRLLDNVVHRHNENESEERLIQAGCRTHSDVKVDSQ